MKFRADKIALFAICLYLFFSYLSFNMTIVFAVGILGVVILLLGKQKYTVNIDIVISICVGVFVVLHELFFIHNMVLALEFSVVIIMFSVVAVYIGNKSYEVKKTVCRYLFFLSLVHVIAVILEKLFPSFIMKINRQILFKDSYRVVNRLIASGRHAGIAPQTGTAAYFIGVFLLICFLKIIIEKDKRYIPVEIMGIVALILTKKRAHTLIYFFIVLLFIMYFLVQKFKGRNKNLFRIFLTFSIIVLSIYVYFSVRTLMLQIDMDELSSGRLTIYKVMLDYTYSGLYMGNGFGFVMSKVHLQGHNIYLQLLCEYGVFSIIFIVWFFYWFKSTYKKYKESEQKNLFINAFSLGFQMFFLLYGIFGNPLYDYFELGLYMIIFAISDDKVRGIKVEGNAFKRLDCEVGRNDGGILEDC